MVVADLNRLWIVLKYSKRVIGMSNHPIIKKDDLLPKLPHYGNSAVHIFFIQ
jgi:hypothetical protein